MPQRVYLSVTQAGHVGLFTDGYLAWPLSGPELAEFLADPEAYCGRLQFQYVEKEVTP